MNGSLSLAARWAVVIAVLSAMTFGFVPFADAHTDFESSAPADQEVVDYPVSEIRLRFSAASIIAGDGFVVLTPTGELLQPEVRVSDDEREFTIVLDAPLTDGVIGLQWSVRAGDAHPIEGAFSFTTTASAIAPDLATSPTVIIEPTPAPAQVAAPDTAAQVAAPDTASPQASAGIGEQAEAPAQVAAAQSVSMDDFLNAETGSGVAGSIGYLGRLASQAGSLVAIGVIGFALLVSTREQREHKMFVLLIRQASALTLIGAVARAVGLVVEIGNVSEALISTTGLAVGLRAVGASALLIGSASPRLTSTQQPRHVGERALTTVGGGSFSGAIGSSENGFTTSPPATQLVQPLGGVGATQVGWGAVIALSFVFDGHTVSKGNHLLTGLVAVIHVVGAAVWLGGLICLVLMSRMRQFKGAEFITTVVRFSVIAAVALGAVGAAGLVLTFTILDSVSELWTTAWGRILIGKVLIVAVAVAAGAFNHFVLVPEMQSVSAHDDARQSFVRTMLIELAAIGAAVALTAFLVVAAS